MDYTIVRKNTSFLIVECHTYQGLEAVKNKFAEMLKDHNFAPFVGLSINFGLIEDGHPFPVTFHGMVYTLDFIEKGLKNV